MSSTNSEEEIQKWIFEMGNQHPRVSPPARLPIPFYPTPRPIDHKPTNRRQPSPSVIMFPKA